ncbi:hypothetical protein D0864_03631 [Hortaea werneckii]|uniref:YTH domain-containing protein n=1 Tax=Hortaea werneckii TaxID=91943 RepID=A0A3M7H0A3_HORWE|nr:hypothetical protein KC323_g4781 [Hortaea werneckii]KAI7352864.1 hypothetical protein KC320_g4290 [Hortaea werneckii]RMZ00813.1 hypothetical protein D0864_03631 [Hortaea werneckii]RMZ06703.1 hypothetical protein D0862_04522 [Hortaea werneckii]
MGDFNSAAPQGIGGQFEQDASAPTESSPSQAQQPFHNQFYSQDQRQSFGPGGGQHGGFDMRPMLQALPQPGSVQGMHRAQYSNEGTNILSPASVYQMQNAAHYQPHPGMQQPHAHSGYQPMQSPRQPGIPPQSQGPYSRMDMYGYPMGTAQYPSFDPRLNAQPFAPMGGPMNPELAMFTRRASETAPVPSYPRGPPRKPRQSGHALWVGNLPPSANVTDLKDHFSRDATKEIESLFLISKSNCAFVNYRTESACVAAMNRFHDSRFQGVRLVCRLRRGSSANVSSSFTNEPVDAATPSPTTSSRPSDQLDGDIAASETRQQPLIVGQKKPEEPVGAVSEDRATMVDGVGAEKIPEKFFVVKSLTVQDLEASVRNGTWATQSHNEEALNKAYEEAENVYLIFSANKSGEYFGYARMASRISGDPVSLGTSTTTEREDTKSTGTPQSIPTPATQTAPKGHIVDDSARGTIFWEAEHSDGEAEPSSREGAEGGDGQNWGRQFQIEWISTARLPFFRTRGLRNPWNANREVKIARDGTELEPGIGRRLVQMFHRPMPHVQPAGSMHGMHYR